MSVYEREKPEHLLAALYSIAEQSCLPAEVLLIKDGPLNPELENVIKKFSADIPLKTHLLPVNAGLATALNAGLKLASQPWIMRFDSDDICVKDRVKIQSEIATTKLYDLFGSQVDEFDSNPNQILHRRQVPCEHDEIIKFSRRRNPFNHMTTCFRRNIALSVGGYPRIHLMEDYALWTLMLCSGARAMNSEQAIVKARVGNGMISRRGGSRYIKSEIELQRFLVRNYIKSPVSAIYDGLIRGTVFMCPNVIRSLIYKRFLRG